MSEQRHTDPKRLNEDEDGSCVIGFIKFGLFLSVLIIGLPYVFRDRSSSLNAPQLQPFGRGEKVAQEPSLPQPSGLADRKAPSTAEKLVGTWVVTKASRVKSFEKATFEFKKGGRLRQITIHADRPHVLDIGYSLEGDTLILEYAKDIGVGLRLRTLTADRLVLASPDDELDYLELERKQAE